MVPKCPFNLFCKENTNLQLIDHKYFLIKKIGFFFTAGRSESLSCHDPVLSGTDRPDRPRPAALDRGAGACEAEGDGVR